MTLYCNIKSFWQRGKRGYADRDLLSLDDYLCTWLPQALRQLATMEPQGYPAECGSWESWEQNLEQMAAGFEAGHQIISLDFWVLGDTIEQNRAKDKELSDRFDAGLALFAKYFFGLWR